MSVLKVNFFEHPCVMSV